MLRTRTARVVYTVLTVALATWAVTGEREAVLAAAGRLSPGAVALAVLATLANLLTSMMIWRTALADLGSPLPLATAGRIYFVGQLGKYLPGSVWPMVAQAELGRDHGVPRKRTATATVVMLLMGITSAFMVVLVTLPLAPVLPQSFRWAVVFLVPTLVLLHPRVLGWLVDRALLLAGRPPLGSRNSMRGIAVGMAWAAVSWVCAGLQVFTLVRSVGAPADLRTVALAVGGYTLAWAVGFLVIVAPAGAGAREVALAAVLAAVLDRGEIVVVVLLSRVLFTVADLLFAAVGLGVGRPRALAGRS
jgi:uncharacterized membrane protein YbhN (UPF0104 family)